MTNFKLFLLVIGLGMFVAAIQSSAIADPNYREEKLTFNQPVEIPGMVLEPGTYDFRYLNSDPMPGVVLIYNNKGHLLREVMAEGVYRSEPTDNTVVTFEKIAPKAPEGIKDWFFPGTQNGVEFIYSHHTS